MSPSTRVRGGDRGVTDIAGVVFLIGILVVAIGAVTVTGFEGLTDGRDRANVNAVANELTKLSNGVTAVTLGSRDELSIKTVLDKVEGNGAVVVDEDIGSITVTFVNDTGTVILLDDISLGGVRYVNRNLDRNLTYQSGAIWDIYPDHVDLRSSPPLSLRSYGGDTTFTYAIISIEPGSGRHLSHEVTIVRDPTTPVDLYPAKILNTDSHLEISIVTAFPTAWQRYLIDTGVPSDEITVTDADPDDRYKTVTFVIGEDQELFVKMTHYRVSISGR